MGCGMERGRREGVITQRSAGRGHAGYGRWKRISPLRSSSEQLCRHPLSIDVARVAHVPAKARAAQSECRSVIASHRSAFKMKK